jgi:hypothetical protein
MTIVGVVGGVNQSALGTEIIRVFVSSCLRGGSLAVLIHRGQASRTSELKFSSP